MGKTSELVEKMKKLMKRERDPRLAERALGGSRGFSLDRRREHDGVCSRKFHRFGRVAVRRRVLLLRARFRGGGGG